MCDRIAIINKGNLVALDTTEKLLEKIQTKKATFKVKSFNGKKDFNVNGAKFFINSDNSIAVSYDKKSSNLSLFFKNLLKKFSFFCSPPVGGVISGAAGSFFLNKLAKGFFIIYILSVYGFALIYISKIFFI